MEPELTRAEDCPKCEQPAAGESQRCIFCGHSLMLETIRSWRTVYTPSSYADAMLASTALESHGLVCHVQQCSIQRLFAKAPTSVMVAKADYMQAQEVVRQVRGVRTDTEYLEWQEIKRRREGKKRLWVALIAAAAVSTGLIVAMIKSQDTQETPSNESRSYSDIPVRP